MCAAMKPRSGRSRRPGNARPGARRGRVAESPRPLGATGLARKSARPVRSRTDGPAAAAPSGSQIRRSVLPGRRITSAVTTPAKTRPQPGSPPALESRRSGAGTRRYGARVIGKYLRGKRIDGSEVVRRAPPKGADHFERVVQRQPWNLVIPHLEKVGADVGTVLPRLRRFAEILLEWNQGFSNLISRKDEQRIVERHIIESLEPAVWLRDSGAKRWLDFGSGGGFPAIPLALAGIGEHWTLVESRRNKTLFLRKILQEMKVKSVSVELARLEMLAPDEDRLGRFEGFTSRATLRLGPTLMLAAEWVQPGGSAFLWKGSRRHAEMASDRDWRLSWDDGGTLELASNQTVVSRFIRKKDE